MAVVESELCSLEEKNGALAKALNSRIFARSEQLKAFLRYICEAEALRHDFPLNEYVIGVEVLGRPEGYSPAEDSSVRTRAYELRQKLEKLYALELPDEEIQISIPKGTYTPQYLRRQMNHAVAEIDFSQATEPVTATPPATVKPRWNIGPIFAAGLILAALSGSAATWLAGRHSTRTPEPDPVLAEAWGPLAQGPGAVLLTVATPLSLVAGPFGHEVFGSENYPAPAETYPLFRAHRLLPADGRLGLTFSDNMLAVGTMNAALICASTLHGFGSSFQLLPDRIASVSVLRGRNAILLGAAVDSETITVAMQDMALTVEFDPAVHEFVVRDRATGRAIVPKRDGSGDLAEVYGLITVKKSSDEKSWQQMVLLSGITSVGIQGAAEFFSSPSAMRSLRSKMGSDRAAHFPGVYQVVVKCHCNKLSLLSAEYFEHRILANN